MGIVTSVQSISARRDSDRDLTEYTGIGRITNTCVFGKNAVGEQINIPEGASVVYVLREYNGATGIDPFTTLTLHYVVDLDLPNQVYTFSDSTCCGLTAAAHMWGIDNYRE